MRTTGLFETHSVDIEFKKWGETISLFPFGDVHWGAPGFSMSHWKAFIKEAKSRKNAFFIGMGDYWDFASASERKALRNSDLHESTEYLLAGLATKQIIEFEREIRWMKGRVIGFIGGNHTYLFEDGTTADERLAQRMGAKFLGVCGLVRLRFRFGTNERTMYMAAHHGVGGYGKTTGAQFNNVDDFANYIDGTELFLMGDNHGRGIMPSKNLKLVPYYIPRTGEVGVKAREVYLGRTGSFLRAYMPGQRNFIVEKAKAPSNLGHIEIQFRINKTQKNGVQSFDVQMKGVA